MAGVRVPLGALKSEPAPANNVIPGRPKTPSRQGALQRARQMAATSAEQLLTASSNPGASLVKGQSAVRGAFLLFACAEDQQLNSREMHYARSN